ncbi:hypothetical protein ACRAWF_43140 [Streptomyces sp. L7]
MSNTPKVVALAEREPRHRALLQFGKLLGTAEQGLHLVGVLRLGLDAYQQTDLHVTTPRVRPERRTSGTARTYGGDR